MNMAENIPQGIREAQYRARLSLEVNEALNVLAEGERNMFIELYSNVSQEHVNPVVLQAAHRARAFREGQNETDQLTAALEAANTARAESTQLAVTLNAATAALNAAREASQGPPPPQEGGGAAPNTPEPAQTPVSDTILGIDKETRKRFLNDLRVINNFDGTIPNDAARKWTRDCDRYFLELSRLTGHDSPDQAKVLHASGKLVRLARQRLEQREKHRTLLGLETFDTWKEFKEWLEWEFAEHLSTEKLYERYELIKQGNQSIQEYAANLQQVISDLSWNIPDPMLIQRFVTGTKPTYRAKWAEERDQPKDFQAVIVRFAQYEQGRAIARRHETTSRHPDAMDIDGKVLTAADSSARPTTSSKETRECHNCGKKGHLARNCRKTKTEETRQKQKAASERSTKN